MATTKKATARDTFPVLEEGHPYRGVGDGTYSPRGATPKVWEAARPLTIEILGTDARSAGHRPEQGAHRRSALAGYLTWLAGDDPDLLQVDIALSDSEIGRYLATDGRTRRSSHRSRVALRSLLRSFRGAYPHLFPPARTAGGDEPTLAPVEDRQFDIAYDTCAGFRNAVTRHHARALLLLSRACGLDGGDLRHIAGNDIIRRPGAGLWVVVRRGNTGRQIPVLARYANRLEDLTVGRADRCVISDVPPPACNEAPSNLSGLINRQLRRGGHEFTISPERLRKAWLIEHVASNVPLKTLLGAAGLTGLRSIERLVVEHCPDPPTNETHLAYELGGIVRTVRGRT